MTWYIIVQSKDDKQPAEPNAHKHNRKTLQKNLNKKQRCVVFKT